VVALGAGIIGCGSSKSSSSPSSTSAGGSSGEKKLTVAVMLFGSANDGSWNNSMADSVVSLAKPLNLNVRFIENVSQPDATRAMESLASTNPGLVVAHAYEFGTALDAVASKFSSVHFFQGTPADNNTYPNADHYDFRAGNASYLAGMAAAAVSKNHYVAVTAGAKQPTTQRDSEAFILGAKALDPTVKASLMLGHMRIRPAERTRRQLRSSKERTSSTRSGTAQRSARSKR